MSTPATEINPSQLDELDFEPDHQCEHWSSHEDPAIQCPNQGSWLRIVPCCANSSYACDGHRYQLTSVQCRRCRIKGLHSSDCQWIKL